MMSLLYTAPPSNTSLCNDAKIQPNSSVNNGGSTYSTSGVPKILNENTYEYSSSDTTNIDKSYAKTEALSAKPRVPMNSSRLVYVDALVDTNAFVIESIWRLPHFDSRNTSNGQVVPLRDFIEEVLKRSRTTYSTLQTALFYIFRSRPELEKYLSKIQKSNAISSLEDACIGCGRRMFLASLVVASKFVQDKTYRNSAWAKIAGLPVNEVNMSERVFLKLVKYQLYINQSNFERWHCLLNEYIEAKTCSDSSYFRDLSILSFFTATQDRSNLFRYDMINGRPDSIMETPSANISTYPPLYTRSNTNKNMNSVVSYTAYLQLLNTSHSPCTVNTALNYGFLRS